MRTDLKSIIMFGSVSLGICAAQDATAQNARINDTASVALDPITVTSDQRTDAIEKLPAATTVIASRDLGYGKVNTLDDVAQRSVNAIFSSQGGPFTIRGIGSPGLDAGVDRQPSVGVFLDNVYIARPFGYPTFLTDVSNVEVIRGSQATLFGKNTIGGAVNIILRDPGTVPGVEAEAGIGSYPSGRLQAGFDTHVGSSAFNARGFVAWTGQNGYIRNLPNGQDVSDVNALATRFVIAGPLGEATKLRLSFDYSRNRDDGGLWYAPLPLAQRYRAMHDFKPDNKLDIGGITARVDHDFDAFRITSITALRGHGLNTMLDGDFTAAPLYGQAQTEEQRQFSQDLRFTSTLPGPFRWTGGLFYMHERFNAAQFFDMATVPRELWSRDVFKQDTDTYSAFGEIAYRFDNGFELIGGLRYTHETKSTTSEISSPSGTFAFGSPGRIAADSAFDNLSPEATAVYHLSEDKQVFAKVSRGFKAGGVSPYIEADGTANRYQPETTTSYEIGTKNSWHGGRYTLNGSLFYIDWSDLQTSLYTTPFTRVIRNAAAATSKGVEVEGGVRLTDNLTVTAGYGYLDARYDTFVDTVLGKTYSGNPLPYAPRTSIEGGLRWVSAITDDMNFVGTVKYAYRTTYSFTPENGYRQPDTHIVDARLGVEGRTWSATLWTKNLLDQRYLRQYFNYSGTNIGVAAQGRTLGLIVAARW
ncbi:TonB-dependent receptor [Methylobacterium sp. Leaf85]|uniref:TonB-dependent receptor n=2 Tax=unclassified Methylobacterium TaxID=2615210 RepID=UPI000A3FACC1|nr:TonB-dependent receptor [Methylobacterium sp. Leaf85]